MTSRRRFLQLGAGAAGALFAMGMLERAFAMGSAPSRRELSAEDARIVRALAPVVLAGALPSPPAERAAALGRIVAGFGHVAAGLDPSERAQLWQLLGFLRWRPSRLLFTGIWHPLDEAAEADIAAFLGRWRVSRVHSLRVAYGGLTQILQASWYDDAASWRRIGYPGPPQLDGARVR